MAKNIKYMGSSDIRIIPKGTDFAGRLSKEVAISKELRWDTENNHVLDLEELEVSSEAIELIVEEPDFKDVTGMTRVPTNEYQQIWLGMPKSEDADEALGAQTSEASTSETPPPAPRTSEATGARATTGRRTTS